jgi:hypothetical protein
MAWLLSAHVRSAGTWHEGVLLCMPWIEYVPAFWKNGMMLMHECRHGLINKYDWCLYTVVVLELCYIGRMSLH